MIHNVYSGTQPLQVNGYKFPNEIICTCNFDYISEQRLAEIYEEGFNSVEEWVEFQERLERAGEFARRNS